MNYVLDTMGYCCHIDGGPQQARLWKTVQVATGMQLSIYRTPAGRLFHKEDLEAIAQVEKPVLSSAHPEHPVQNQRWWDAQQRARSCQLPHSIQPTVPYFDPWMGEPAFAQWVGTYLGKFDGEASPFQQGEQIYVLPGAGACVHAEELRALANNAPESGHVLEDIQEGGEVPPPTVCARESLEPSGAWTRL